MNSVNPDVITRALRIQYEQLAIFVLRGLREEFKDTWWQQGVKVNPLGLTQKRLKG